ncbi:MAG: hypothetical protein IPK83_00475 [Planctomycetes bacterium]|nr:hypothetical protein [Planctomycetota bacterium]
MTQTNARQALPLGPYDRFFLASGMALRAKGLPEHHVFARVLLRGSIDCELLRRQIRSLYERTPLLTAQLRISKVLKQPSWRLGEMQTIDSRIQLEVIDLRREEGPSRSRDELLIAALNEKSACFGNPDLRFWLLHHSDDEYELVIRWPHHLTDLSGVEQWLGEIGKTESGHASPFPPHRVGKSHYGGLRAWLRGMWHLRTISFLKGNRLKAKPPKGGQSTETLHHGFSVNETSTIVAAARRTCTPGPLLHTRWQLAAVVRAIDSIFARSDVHLRDNYLISLPMRNNHSAVARQQFGNNITIDTLVLNRDCLKDPCATDRALAAQLSDHSRRRLDDANLATTAFVGKFPLPLYGWLLRRFRIFPRFSIAFTSYRVDAKLGEFLGCRVTDFSTWGVPTSPPGIIAAFCRFEDRLNFSLTYFTHVCSSELAREICSEIVAKLGIGVDSGEGVRTNEVSTSQRATN